jgi:dihydrofolate reductase
MPYSGVGSAQGDSARESDYLTIVQAEIEGDTYMPEWTSGEWREAARTTYAADEKNPHDFILIVYERA